MYTKLMVEISQVAEQDLQTIWSTIASHNPREASRLVQKLAYKIFTLEYLAHQCQELSPNQPSDSHYRQLECDGHRILFQLQQQHVQILRILSEHTV